MHRKKIVNLIHSINPRSAKKILLCCLFSLLGLTLMLCLSRENILQSLKITRRSGELQKRHWQILAKKIEKQDFSFLGDIRKKSSLASIIKDCALELSIKNILIKQSIKNGKYFDEQSASIKFSFPQEKIAYDFLDKLYQRTNGIIVQDLIQIIRTGKMKFDATMDLRIFTIHEKNKLPGIKVHAKKYQLQKPLLRNITLFQADETPIRYTLLCLIGNFQAYINDCWVQEGDKIDDFSIIRLGQDSIDIKSNKKTLNNIRVGAVWSSTDLNSSSWENDSV
jgi:hypothetical protein